MTHPVKRVFESTDILSEIAKHLIASSLITVTKVSKMSRNAVKLRLDAKK